MTTQLWRRSSAVLENLTELQSTTFEQLKTSVKTSVSTEVARLNREFYQLEGLTMRRIDDRIEAGQFGIGSMHESRKGRAVYSPSPKVSGQDSEDEMADEVTGYQLRSAVF